MAVHGYERPRVMAVLGPTNTGKTHFAVERMLAHPSGLIGFPLRLLAREIYDRIIMEKGAAAAALITGEERIAPPGARYVVATVEAMPLDLDTSFLAVDEIQLCADLERGHVFTDRLLNARGRDETMFLGAATIRPLLRQLVPEAEVITRPRFSTLSYVAPVKVIRLPRRSALVAFTAQEVYTLAELVRRHRGGAAVVMGALSPRTRNAQVALYQAGEVDYLIATDAIGMGLNMDLGHVALAALSKFDGREQRRLHAHEVAQIAGRAGRHMHDGTFSTTPEAGELEPKMVEAVESHDFPALRQLRWRSSALDFSSLDHLTASLEAPAPAPCLIRTRDAIDEVSLRLLGRRPQVRDRATSPAGVRLLWSVCQIPDFRKTLTDAHLRLLDTVFRHLAGRGRLPVDWVADQVARLERTDGDIDSLIARLAYIRTWTYVAHRGEWLDDALHWQERTRAVEDRLSDALHDRLTQRFIDRRTQALLKSLQAGGPVATVEDDGAVVVDGHQIAQLHGLQLTLLRDVGDAEVERRAMAMAARRAAVPALRRRVEALADAGDDAFALDAGAGLSWRDPTSTPALVAQLRPGANPLAPRLELKVAESLSPAAKDIVRRRLARWLDAHLARLMRPLRQLQAAELEGPGRGLAFLLVEGLGNTEAAPARALLGALSDRDRRTLGRMGVRFGVRHLYLPAMLRSRVLELRALLWAVHHHKREAMPPPAARVAYPCAGAPPGLAQAVGFEALGPVHLRIDMVERLAARLRALSRNGAFALPPDLASLVGVGPPALAAIVEDLGYEQAAGDGRFRRSTKKRRRPSRPRRTTPPDSPFAALQQLTRRG